MNEEYEMLKAKFLRLYAHIPTPLRTEIVAVVDNQPLSWSACMAELENNTDKAPKVIDQLKKIGVL